MPRGFKSSRRQRRTSPDMAQAFPDSFATRHDAEKEIAKRNLAGIKKPQRLVGRWHLVDNPTGAIGISQFIQCAIVEAQRQGINASLSEIAVNASQAFRDAMRKRKGRR